MTRPAVTAAVLLAFVALVALVLAGCGSSSDQGTPAVRADGRTPVIVDTDVSTDDIIALLYLARRDDVDLRAVTVSGTGLATCPAGARNTLALLAAAGRLDIPVACGRPDPVAGFKAFPPAWRDRADQLSGLELPAAGRAADSGGAVALMRRALDASGLPTVTVLSLAPMTNTAQLLSEHPDVRSRIARVVAMGGAVHVPGNVGPGHERSEYYLWVDADRRLAGPDQRRSGHARRPGRHQPGAGHQHVRRRPESPPPRQPGRATGVAAVHAHRHVRGRPVLLGRPGRRPLTTPDTVTVRPRRVTVITAPGPTRAAPPPTRTARTCRWRWTRTARRSRTIC
jgi:Inosine-uridine preferring nucleoside hydrolase